MSTNDSASIGAKKTFAQRYKSFIGDYVIIYAVIALFIVLSFVANNFLTLNNIMNVLRQISMTAIIAIGTFFLMNTGALDISAGSLVGITGIIFSGAMVKFGIDPIPALLLTLIAGGILGAINGVMVTVFGIPAFVATLGMQSVARGLTYVMTNAYPISGLPASIAWLGRGYLLDIVPWPVIIMLVLYMVAHFVSQRTKFGRFVYAVGGNSESAYLSGIKVNSIRRICFIVGGVAASLSGCILVSRLNSGQPTAGIGWEFEAVTATVIGGVSLSGGKGKVFGVLLGSILVGLLTNGMTLLNVNSYWQDVIKGVVLVAAIGVDVFKTKRDKRVK